MLKTPKKKSVTPSHAPRKNGTRQTSVKREPPEIDLSAIRPPSPTEDPLLLSARRARRTIRSRVTPVFSSSPLYPTSRHANARDTQSPAWTDTDSEGEGEYTGRFKMFHVPTKADPPTSGTRARMEEWGRPVSPFPYEARLDRSLPDPEDMEVAEDEGMEGNILDALDIESVFEDVVEVPPVSDDLSSDPPTNDVHIGAEESEDSDVDVESNVVRITGSDPKAAARAAAILKLHDYDCVLASSKRAVRKPRTTFIGAGIGKRRSTMQRQRAIHRGDETPWCDVEDIMQDRTFIEQHTPIKTPLQVSLAHTGERASHPLIATFPQPQYNPKAGEWRREDWKLLDRCFFEECHVNGVIVAPEEVNREAVAMRFTCLAGGYDVVTELGPPWSWENLLARVDVLIKKRAARDDLSTLSFTSFMSPDVSTPANITSTPVSHIPRYRDLFDEASAIDTTNVPISTPSCAARSQPTIVPSNHLAEKTGFFSILPTWTSFLPRRVHIKPDDHPIKDRPPLPPPPTDILDRRKPVMTPARKRSEQQKPHRDLVNLHHTTPLQKRVQLRKNKPKRLIELRHISPEPLQHLSAGDRRARRSSGGSVKDLIQCFEGTKDLELAGGGGSRSIQISANAVQNRLAWKL
ncbi:uncharacterized protein EDB91DRAFT_467034 [Suillus paluster]|uniref:uncharacterized protein n=1 Tax=Suillus paluster TaxID=48578 RepID=UPI001B86E39A|nr:uncharacterized protein EDB91DRAFT_467034 [Suillus paluster]KAG1738142.1 hypothetical protein EDB91DRAFT_467034 [Suillus paluster]